MILVAKLRPRLTTMKVYLLQELPTITDNDIDNIMINIDSGYTINIILTDDDYLNKTWFCRAVKELCGKTPNFNYKAF